METIETPTKEYKKSADLMPHIVKMRSEGATNTEIGAALGITRQRVYQILESMKHGDSIEQQYGWPFSTREYNILTRLNIIDRDHATILHNSGRLHPHAITGLGWKSYVNICAWLNVDPIKSRPKDDAVINDVICSRCSQRV